MFISPAKYIAERSVDLRLSRIIRYVGKRNIVNKKLKNWNIIGSRILSAIPKYRLTFLN